MKRKWLLLGLLVVVLTVPGVAYLRSRQQSQDPADRPAIQIEPESFDRFVGQYVSDNDPDQVFSVFREDDKFYVQRIDGPRIEIFAEGEGKFFTRIIDAQIFFEPNSLVLRQPDNARESLKKISDKPLLEVLENFQKSEQMIAMRDGVRLNTLVFRPMSTTDKLPIILHRTPYGVGDFNSLGVNKHHKELVKDGYIIVLQDIRGRYKSEGQFVMLRPPRDKKAANSVDESTDAYDTIEWLVKNVENNNGRVGIMGASYDGWLAAMATLDPHPALKAASVEAPMTDTFLGDDFFHNGAFRQSMGYEFLKSFESSKESAPVKMEGDSYDWYLGQKTLSKITEQVTGKLPTWDAFVAHPNYDDYWKARALQRHLTKTSVSTLVVGGMYDAEDFYGVFATYQALEKHDTKNQNFLVLGPWTHGGWKRGFGRTLGELNFGGPTALHFRSQIRAPWFASLLKDKPKAELKEAMTFQSGCNQWVSHDSWPPRNTVARELYLQGGKQLSFSPAPPDKSEEFASYVSDPANPVPYRPRPIDSMFPPEDEESGWPAWLVQDQRFLKDRADIVSWQSEGLSQDLSLSGDIVARIFASTTGTDSDWIVKVIDVYPDNDPQKALAGDQLMVASEIFRGRFRQSFETPKAITPEAVNEYVIDLRGINHCFKKDHRIMVQVQSTWFPLYDRNPQKFVENIFKAQPSDYQSATQRIYQSARYPSRLILPITR
ncbi:MAG TPA: CocE/NonD family hydrolase [Pyrinomonadaceae bacterium]|nr:CocE/NonD family hydrolase [Pyrinomonadaceae bacterium]